MSGVEPEGVDCQDFVELITDYLEGALADDERARIDDHLRECPGCHKALDQWRLVVRMSGALSEREVGDLDPDTRDELFEVFRSARPT